MVDRNHTLIKICGVTRPEDAVVAVTAGCEAVGVILWPGSPRHIDWQHARTVRAAIPKHVLLVGVFVDADRKEVEEAITGIGLDAVQLSGAMANNDWSEFSSRARCLRAVRVGPGPLEMSNRQKSIEDYVLDTRVDGAYGGTGKTFDWNLVAGYRDWGRIWLAGGLTPGNVGSAIATVRPYAVDVSSGVEISPGVKSHDLIRRFATAVREADAQLGRTTR